MLKLTCGKYWEISVARVEFRLLGAPEIAVNGAPAAGLPAKLEALLYYLAAAPRSVARASLASMLWPERAEADARMNLRAALQKIPGDLAPYVAIHRDRLALERGPEVSVDAHVLDTTLATLAVAEDAAPRLARLRSVAMQCRGDFLEGFSSRAPEFDAWCEAERTRLREGTVRLCLEVLRLEKEAGADDDAAQSARRILRASPGHDPALRELMGALARSGRRSAAVEAYERHRQAWRDELGVAPSAETERLAERIASGEPLAGAGTVTPPAPVAMPLLGREHEQALVEDLLGGGRARVVTLTGLGGIGKTRLAHAVMERAKARFPDGTRFFALGAMRSGAGVGPALAAGLGLQLRGDQVARQLQDYLREKSILLVLDAFESVAASDAVDLLLSLTHAAPGLRCLVTSREALGIAEEAVVALEGLAYPEGDAALGAGWRDFAAVRLFVERAARGYAQFDAERERDGIVRFCQRVQGIPLAIELAASLARNLPCVEIARAVERDLATLVRSDASLSPRHRSMEGVLNCAFEQLAPELQACVARLSAFRGPFRSDSAEPVAGASLRQLSTLVDKSWVRRDAAAGYVLHDVIRQYAQSRRGALGIDTARLDEAHAMHFAGWLSRVHDAMQRGDEPALLADTRDSLSDVLAACEWGFRAGQDAAFERPFHALQWYFEARGDYVSAEHCWRRGLEALGRNRRARKRRLHATSIANLGWSLTQMSRYDEGVPLLEESLALSRAAGADLLVAEALRAIALARVLQGRAAEAAPLLEEGMALARGHPYLEMATLNVMGVAASFGGVGHRQADYYRQVLAIAEAHGYPRGAMVAHFNLGDEALAAGEHEAAEPHFRRAIELGRRVGNSRNVCMSLANLAAIAQIRRDFAATRRCLDEAWEIARALGERRLHSFIYQGYAELEGLHERWSEAEAWARKMVEVADEIAWSWSAAFGRALLAEVLTRTGRRDAALVAVRDLHARVQATSFAVHHANTVLESARWMLAFGGDRGLAHRLLRSVAQAEGVDDWARIRARAIPGAEGAGPLDGGPGDWMARAVGALPDR